MAEKSRLTVEEVEALRERILRRLGESTRLREELGQYQFVLCELGQMRGLLAGDTTGIIAGVVHRNGSPGPWP